MLARRRSTTAATLFLRPRDPERERWTGHPRAPLARAAARATASTASCAASPSRAGLSAAPPAGLRGHHRAGRRAGATTARTSSAPAQLAARFGLKVEYKRDLLARLRSAHASRGAGAPGARDRDHPRRARGGRPRHRGRRLASATCRRRSSTPSSRRARPASPTRRSSAPASNGASSTGTTTRGCCRTATSWSSTPAADYGRYASDITRTYPVAESSARSRRRSTARSTRPRRTSSRPSSPASRWPTCRRPRRSRSSTSGYLEAFIHGFGHFVGLDVHDAGRYDLPLPVGAVFTVEPGIYLPEQRLRRAHRGRGGGDRDRLPAALEGHPPQAGRRRSLGGAGAQREVGQRSASSSAADASVFSSRYFTITGRVQREAVLLREGAGGRARARHHHRALRDAQRLVGRAPIRRLAGHVVDGDGRR